MAIKPFTLAALPEFDNGLIAAGFDQAVRRCVEDCDDRAHVKTARIVILRVSIMPIQGAGGVLDEIKTTFTVSDSAPKRETKPYSMKYRKDRHGGNLIFNEDSPADVKTRSFDELGGKAAEAFARLPEEKDVKPAN
jgi:hypothetical protein